MTDRSIFYIADSQAGIETINKMLGKTLSGIYKGPIGCLLQFSDSDQYLILLGCHVPMVSQPRDTETPGMKEITISGTRQVVAASLTPSAGTTMHPEFWELWDDHEAQVLIGQMMTGYSPSKSKIETGEQLDSAMLEFGIKYFLVVTPVSVYVMSTNSEPSVS